MADCPLVTVPCPACASDDSTHQFFTRDYRHRLAREDFGVRRCRRCGCGYLSPRPSEGDLGRFYDHAFYWSFEGREDLTPQELLQARASQLQAKADCLAHLAPGRLLDVGAMKGEFLHFMRERGWEVDGVESGVRPPNLFDVPIRYGEFLDMDFGGGHFDCITMWAVLEHVYRPRDYVRKVAALLRPGGTCVLLVTNFNSIQGRLYGADDFPRHLTLFTKRVLRRLFEENDLQTVRLWTDQTIFGGQLRGGLVYALKRLLGYDAHEVLYEWKDMADPLLFCGKWHGRPSRTFRWVSRLDQLLLMGPEKLLDWSGHGLTLLAEARRRAP